MSDRGVANQGESGGRGLRGALVGAFFLWALFGAGRAQAQQASPTTGGAVAPVLAAPPAAADGQGASRSVAADSGRVTRSYGGQIIIGDVAGVVVSGVLAPHLGAAALLPYLLASPAIHLAHRNAFGALSGLGLHLLLPLGALLIDLATSPYWAPRCGGDACDPWGDRGTLIVLGSLGASVLAASLIDAIWLAHVTETPPRRQAMLAPIVAPSRSGGATFGVAATF